MEYKRFEDTVFLRVDPGEDIIEKVLETAKIENIALASISGLGAVKEIQIGVFEYAEKKYYPKTIKGIFEITSLLGTLTTKDGEPYLHLHISCGDMNGEVVGGHLNKAIVSATGEIVIRVINGTINRRFSNEIGLFLFDFKND